MSRIDDFGERIDGAAKDRWQDYRNRLEVAIEQDIADQPLSESFPEPPYKTLLNDGLDPETIAFVRAARDLIPAKPRQSFKLARWSNQVEMLRGLCHDLIEGRTDISGLRERLKSPAYRLLESRITSRMDLYLALGHDRSMKGYKISSGKVSRIDGEVFDPPVTRWTVSTESATRMGRILVMEETKEKAIEAFRDKIEDAPSVKKGPKIDIFSFRNNPQRGYVIGHKVGSDLIEIEKHDTVESARARLKNHRGELEEKLSNLRDLPPERVGENMPREGVSRRRGNVAPEMFMATFGFRGVQFGNYVEGKRRQEDLNRAYDALMDLSDVLGCHPKALSLDGDLGLAFGARGRGGKNAFSAHYEPMERVINLTKSSGAGSLAHEWFHALDNHVSRMHGEKLGYATETNGRPQDIRTLFVGLVNTLNLDTRLPARSKSLDRTRSKPYFGTRVEYTARAFEAFVVDRLAEKGVRNDYLANFIDQDVFDAEAALKGQPSGRYPYPTEEEMPTVCDAYTHLFKSPEVIQVLKVEDPNPAKAGQEPEIDYPDRDGDDVSLNIEEDPETGQLSMSF